MAEKTNKTKPEDMESLVEGVGTALVPFDVGTTVTCKIVTTGSHKILCDISGLAYGFVPEKEFSFDTKDLQVGDEVKASVVSMENKDGYVVLSFRRADRDRLWEALDEKKDKGTLVEAKVVNANRGGLMIEVGGISGFLPVSQLSSEHYPRVEGGDTSQILGKLKRLVGETLTVKIIATDKKEEKLIFSEKMAANEALGGAEGTFEVGQEVEGTVTGVAHFGIFVNVQSFEGLVHISEVSWDHVDDLNKLFKIGQKIKAKVVKIENGKISLSIKRLMADPWIEQMKKLRVAQKVEGEVTKVTAYGAFVKIEGGLDGLVHASSNSGDVENIKSLKVKDKRRFEIIELQPESRRIGLRLLD